MTVDHCKLNQMKAPITAALMGVELLLEKIYKVTGV